MTDYESYRDDVRRVYSLTVDEMLKKIAFEQFEQDRGMGVHEVLPDKSEIYDFESHGFEGIVDPDRRTFENAVYDNSTLTVNRIAAGPERYKELIDPLYDAWWDTFGEKTMASQPSHPGEPPVSRKNLKTTFDGLIEEHTLVTADPMMEDLITAVQDKNYRVAAQFLNLDVDPQMLFTPGGSHELTELFMNGDIHIIYKDRDIALLKPEYDHGLTEQVLNQQRTWGRVRLRGEQPELAFVVGIDDTPTGLFVHSIDGTRLDVDQSVTREYIHDVMGFDYNYQHEDYLPAEVGDRVRLQGDLAVEYESEETVDEAPRCNLPIDNHLCMLNHGKLPSGESKDEEPIEVEVPELATLNIMHDEHDNVTTELPEGRLRFYLLPRGLQPPEERPDWPEA